MSESDGIGGTDIVCLPSRLHEDDLPGVMMEDDSGFVYLPLILPMDYEPRLYHPIGVIWATPEGVDADDV